MLSKCPEVICMLIQEHWKSRACLTPEGEVALTPENDFILTL